MHFAVKKWIILVSVLMVLALLAHKRAEAQDNYVIEQVSTRSEENSSVVLIRLSGHPTYRVIPIGHKEILIAFKDTEVSSGVYANETIVGDKLVKSIEIAQKPYRVACLLVRAFKPYGDEVAYQIRESEDALRIEIKNTAKPPEKGPETATSGLSGSQPPLKRLTSRKKEAGTVDLLAVKPGPAAPDTDLFLDAAEYHRMGKWEKAIQILKEIIRSHPKSSHSEQAHFLLARSVHRKFEKEISGHLVDIIRHYQTAINKFPESDYLPGAVVSMGNCYFQVNQYYEAIVYYDLVVRKDKDPGAIAEAMFQRGRVLALTKRPLRAVHQFEELEKRYPETPSATRAQIEMAKTLFDIKSFKRSLLVLNEITRTRPDEVYKDSDILLYTGYNYYELGQLREARDVFSEVVNYFPEMKSTDLLLTRIGDTYREEGMQDRASKLYELVGRIYPDTEGGLISLLRLAAEAEKAEAENQPSDDQERHVKKTAHEIYEQIIADFPDEPLSQLAMLKLANLEKKDKRYKESIKILRDILGKHPEKKLRLEVEKALQDTALKLALLQQENGNNEQSVMTLKEILAQYPATRQNKDFQSALRVSLKAIFEEKEQKGKIEDIVSCYQQMKSVIPFEDMPNILLLLGEVHKRLHLYGHGLSIFRKARGFYANQDQPADLLLGLGECAYEEKEFDEAEGTLKAFVAGYPGHRDSSKAHYWLGKILLQRQEYERALKSLKAALCQKPEKYYRVKVLTAMANASRGLDDYEKAATWLNESIALLNDDESSSSEDLYIAYRQLGENYLKLGQKEKAVPALEKALELNPEGPDTHSLQFGLAQCYQSMKDPGKAEKILNRIMTSGDPFWSKVARAQINDINIEKSVEEYGSGVTGSPPATPAL